MNIEHIIYFSLALTLVLGFGLTAYSLGTYFKMLEIRYKKEIKELKFKEEKLKQDTALANLELAKTYKEIAEGTNQDSKKQEEQFKSFGEAITDVFKDITKEGE